MPERKIILITGAARGIGVVTAENFARLGWPVAIHYHRSAHSALALQNELLHRYGPGAALAVAADVACREAVQAMFEQVNAGLGPVDALVNNAGANLDGPFLEMSVEQWRSVLDVILTGTFLCSQEFARRYRGGEGHIVNIGSLSALEGRTNGANYCSARAGVIALTRCMALELAPAIRVNCVSPGYIATQALVERYHLDDPQRCAQATAAIPAGSLGKPEDVFQAIRFLVCESRGINGENLIVDGGKLLRSE
jgi:acetoacetyl-CoA reductase/3-oxoacyl-[acyl-carrier protein] reductase